MLCFYWLSVSITITTELTCVNTVCMCEWTERVVNFLFPSIHPSGDVHQVNIWWPTRHHRNDWRGKPCELFLLVATTFLSLNLALQIGFHWDDPELSPLQRFLAAELMLAGLVVDTDTKRSITADPFTALLLLSVFCVWSLQLTAVRRSTQEMKSFKSITRLW